jgi:hypothetical protein
MAEIRGGPLGLDSQGLEGLKHRLTRVQFAGHRGAGDVLRVSTGMALSSLLPRGISTVGGGCTVCSPAGDEMVRLSFRKTQ